MKKQIALLTTALLATSFVLGATSCASNNVSKALKSVSVSENTTAVSALKKDDSFSTVDYSGLMVVSKENYETVDNTSVLKSTTYKLFDVTTNAYISGAEVTVDANAPEVNENTASTTEYTQFTAFDNNNPFAFYYTLKTVKTYQTGSLFETKYYISLYGKNGKIADNLELKDLISNLYGNGVFTYTDGTRYYLDINGNVAKEEDSLAKILTYNDVMTNYEAFTVAKDYIIENDDAYSVVYDKNGKYIRTINGAYELDVPASIKGEPQMWAVDNYMFVQYSVMLEEKAKKFDYMERSIDGAVKYDLVTKRYDIEKGKVKEIDMDYVVTDVDEDASMYFNEASLLYVSEIKDDYVMEAQLIQSFDKNGKVAVDLQALVPGAEDIEGLGKDYIVLNASDMEYVVKGKKVIGEFVADSVQYMGNVAYVDGESWIKFYNLDGTLNKSYTDVEEMNELPTGAIIQLENSVVKFDLMTGTETTVCTFGNDDMVMVDDYMVQVMYANDVAKDDDDTASLYWLIPGMTNLTNLTMEKAMEYDFDFVDYYAGGINASIEGVIVTIDQTTGEGENETTTRTVYNYAMKQAY